MFGPAIVVDNINKIVPLMGHHQCLQFSVNPSTIASHMIPLLEDSKHQIMIHPETKLVYHGAYVYNFCRGQVENQIESLIREIDVATQLKCHVVIHQGKNVEDENISRLEAINNYVRNISDVIDATFNSDSMLLLENSARQGHELGHSVEELSYIYNQFDDHVKERVGFCIDTCHIFVAGELDVRSRDKVIEFIEKFDRLIGLDKL